MSQKNKISIQREDVFQEVDALLTEAMASLDDRNTRVVELLQAESNTALLVPEYAEMSEEAEQQPSQPEGGQEPAAPSA